MRALSASLFVGCYTDRSDVAVARFDIDAKTGRAEPGSSFVGVDNASFLAAHPSLPVLYAVSETVAGHIVALRIGTDGSLTEFDRVPSHGDDPCYVSTDRHGRWVAVANYSSGTVTMRAVRDDGSFGETEARFAHTGSGPTDRQAGPHAHCIVPGPSGDLVYAADLGTDRIVAYEFDPATLGWRHAFEVAMPAGSGPRHLVFHPTRLQAFVVGELDSTLITLDVDTAGRLSVADTVSTLPADFAGQSIAADVHVHPNGRTVYVSNRGHDSIVSFNIDDPTRPPVLLEHAPSGGHTPRNFAIDPSGHRLLVANQDSDVIVAFDLDPTTGALTNLTTIAEVAEPVCLRFVDAPGGSANVD